MALAAPAGTPPAITSKISSDVIAALKTDDMVKTMGNVGFSSVGETPAQFAAFLVTDRSNAAKRVEAANVKMDGRTELPLKAIFKCRNEPLPLTMKLLN
jgi:tripartite-type tricarboxylate transporter receptor subunit TctC